jgi:hypothetical protein
MRQMTERATGILRLPASLCPAHVFHQPDGGPLWHHLVLEASFFPGLGLGLATHCRRILFSG